jgi:ketosteroid isomerase-like protein
MSEENVEVVRKIHDAMQRGVSPASLGLLHPDIEWINPEGAFEPGTRRGLAGFETAIASMVEAFDSWSVEPREFLDAGDRVVVLATFVARGRTSGIQRENEDGYVWTVRDGQAVQFCWFNDPAKALQAAGLPE